MRLETQLPVTFYPIPLNLITRPYMPRTHSCVLSFNLGNLVWIMLFAENVLTAFLRDNSLRVIGMTQLYLGIIINCKYENNFFTIHKVRNY